MRGLTGNRGCPKHEAPRDPYGVRLPRRPSLVAQLRYAVHRNPALALLLGAVLVVLFTGGLAPPP
jgi:hypothetical protein